MGEKPQAPLRELQMPDEMALVFNPIGFGGRMEPEDAARFQRDSIANASLCPDVPDTIRENFDRARKLHLYGVLEYQFFTVASDYALLVLEGALRLRFISHYHHQIPVSRKGKAEILHVESFDDVRQARLSVKLRGSEEISRLPIGARALLAWARQERLLPGSETRRVDHALAELRNYAAHPDGLHVEGPPDSARTLRDVAEVINTLWGYRVPGGRLFPAPVARIPRVAAIDQSGGATEMGLHHVLTLDEREQDADFAVFLAAIDEKLTRREGDRWAFTHRPGVQGTRYPCNLLWQGDYLQLVNALEGGVFAECADTVEHLDRLFFIRCASDTIDPALSPEDLLALDSPRPGLWYAIVADCPDQALSHVTRHEQGPQTQSRHCADCFVRVLGRFTDISDATALARKYPTAA